MRVSRKLCPIYFGFEVITMKYVFKSISATVHRVGWVEINEGGGGGGGVVVVVKCKFNHMHEVNHKSIYRLNLDSGMLSICIKYLFLLHV